VPTYDYQCDKCGRTFELWQRISEAPITTHEVCGGPVRRLLSPAPFILKGGGWYVTDYPSESRKKAAESEKKASSGEQSSTPATASTTNPGTEKSATESSGRASGGGPGSKAAATD
jgi:putative FmdB family regulatory protein